MNIICPHCKIEIDSKYIGQHLGATGGSATLAKYGKAHYQKLAANMNAKIKAKKLAVKP